MADYISREAANKALCEFCGICTEPGDLKECEIVSNYSFPNIPAADVRPVVRGKWEHISFMTCRCSVCKEVFHELEGDNYCPNCGADMRPIPEQEDPAPTALEELFGHPLEQLDELIGSVKKGGSNG